MESKEEKYCLINLLSLPENAQNVESILGGIAQSAHIVLCEEDKEQFIGFMAFNPQTETKGLDVNIDTELLYKVYPFVFAHDEDSRMFIDPITNSAYTYSGLKGNRVYNPDSNSLGDYIINVSSIDENTAKMYLENIKKISFVEYKEALDEFKNIVLKAYGKSPDPQRR